MWDELTILWNNLTILWNDLTIDWNDLTIDWNDLTWNDLTMERNDRKPYSGRQSEFHRQSLRLLFTRRSSCIYEIPAFSKEHFNLPFNS